jgi:transcriptional regulator with XRE-family HTH domain
MAKRKTKIRQADIVRQFAARLRELRQARNLTQAELAGQAHVALSHLSKLESGDASPGLDLLDRLAKSLGMTVTELLPLPETPDSLPELRERAKQLVDHADQETLKMVNPLLARLLRR